MSRQKVYAFLKRYLSSCVVFLVCLTLCYRMVLGVSIGTDSSLVSASGENNRPIIILDAGHGGEDCGTIGVNGVYEKDLNMNVTQLLYGYFATEGYETILTRTDDHLLYDPTNVEKGKKKLTDLTNRVKIANQHENAIFISIHMNNYPSQKVKGLQVWYGKGEGSQMLATCIQNTVKNTIQLDNTRKPKASAGNMYLLDMTECTSALIECGFLSNIEECAKLSDENYQKELSFSIFSAIIEYIGNKK